MSVAIWWVSAQFLGQSQFLCWEPQRKCQLEDEHFPCSMETGPGTGRTGSLPCWDTCSVVSHQPLSRLPRNSHAGQGRGISCLLFQGRRPCWPAWGAGSPMQGRSMGFLVMLVLFPRRCHLATPERQHCLPPDQDGWRGWPRPSQPGMPV